MRARDPVFDPIKALINCATGQDIDMVIVDGEVLVEEGRFTRLDEDALMREASMSAKNEWDNAHRWHWARSKADQISPPSFKKGVG